MKLARLVLQGTGLLALKDLCRPYLSVLIHRLVECSLDFGIYAKIRKVMIGWAYLVSWTGINCVTLVGRRACYYLFWASSAIYLDLAMNATFFTWVVFNGCLLLFVMQPIVSMLGCPTVSMTKETRRIPLEVKKLFLPAQVLGLDYCLDWYGLFGLSSINSSPFPFVIVLPMHQWCWSALDLSMPYREQWFLDCKPTPFSIQPLVSEISTSKGLYWAYTPTISGWY